MSRASKVVMGGLLTLVLASVAVPVGINLAPAFIPAPAAAVLAVPAAQQEPAAIGSLTGVTALSGTAPLPNIAALSASLTQALVAVGGGTFTANVTDAATGKELYDLNGDQPSMPASNLKLLTSVAALKTIGANTRFDTTVLTGGSAGSIVLRGGGDVLLSPGASNPDATVGHAGLATLAAQTAAALKQRHVSGPITLSVDDSLFTGPTLNPNWLQGDIDSGQIAPVYPMALYGARLNPAQEYGARPQDSAMSVAQAFAAALESNGVNVTDSIARGTAPAGAATLAVAQSATVGQQVEYLLQESDNYVAETMGRMVAVYSHKEASSTGAAQSILAALKGLGLDTDGLTLADSCGLSPLDRVTAEQMTGAVKLMLTSPDTDLRQGLLGLPIAGLTGTLASRFTDPDTIAGAGLVRAKTGTLNAVASLSGYVIDSQGRLLVFSFIGNSLKAGNAANVPVLDDAAAILARG